jgi:hypothetical protein
MQPVAANVTSEYAAALQRLSGAQKLASAFAMYRAARRLKRAAVRELHPDWTDERVEKEVREIFLHART